MKRRILATMLAVALCFNCTPCYAAGSPQLDEHPEVETISTDSELSENTDVVEEANENSAAETIDVEMEAKSETEKEVVLEASSISAENIDDSTDTSNNLGGDVYYKIVQNEEGNEKLVIYGNGPMPDYSEANLAPWYDYNSPIAEVEIEEGITAIGSVSFRLLQNLTKVTLPNSLQSIGYWAFYGCGNLSTITVPGSVTHIGRDAFSYCGLKKVILSEGVTSIGDHAFQGSYDLEQIEIPKSLTSIGMYAFGFNPAPLIIYAGSEEEWNNISIGEGTDIEEVTFNNDTIAGEDQDDTCKEHVPGEPVIVEYASHRESGLQEIYCSVCGKKLEEQIIPRNHHIFSGNWCWFCNLYEYDYEDDINGGCTITRYNDTENDLVIKDRINGRSVHTIGEDAFKDNDSLCSVRIPETVESIMGGAFSGCSSLKLVIIPDSVTEIADSAFAGCADDMKIACRKNSYAYTYAADHSISVIADSTNPDECIHDFNKEDVCSVCGMDLQPFIYGLDEWGMAYIQGYKGHKKNIVIPESIDGYAVEGIAYYGLRDCENIESIEIPSCITKIYDFALPSGCYVICEKDSYAYRYAVEHEYTVYWAKICDEHTYSEDGFIIKEPTHARDGVMTRECKVCGFVNEEPVPAEGHSFDKHDVCTVCGTSKEQALFEADFEIEWGYDYCSIIAYKGDAENLVIPEYIEGFRVFHIGDYSNPVVGPDSNLKSITCEHDNVSIATYAFDGCTTLERVYLLGEYSSTNRYSFRGCTNLKEFYNPYSGKNWIPEHTFAGCASLTDFTIPENITMIDPSAFEGCSSLTSIEIPWECKNIYFNAFKDCSSLSDVTIWNESAYIGEDAFAGCSPDLVIRGRENSTAQKYAEENNIVFEALYTCEEHSFDTVIVTREANCKYAGNQKKICSACNYITEEEISPLGHLWTMDDVCCRCGVPVFETTRGWIPGTCSLYSYNGNSEHVIVPEEINGCKVTSISEYAFVNRKNIVSVELPDSILHIGTAAFEGCENLETINLPEKLTTIYTWAFSGCPKLSRIVIPDSVTWIDGFDSGSNITLVGRENSYAHIYAKKHNIPFEISAPAYKNLTVEHDVYVEGYEYGTNDKPYRISFTPEVTGTYIFSSTQSSDVSLCELYDENGELIAGDTDWINETTLMYDYNFQFEAMLNAGETYYLTVYGFYSSYLPSMFVRARYKCPHDSYTVVVEDEATCMQGGMIANVCDLCGEVISKEMLPVTDHKWVNNYCIICNAKFTGVGYTIGSNVNIGSACNIGPYTNIGSACNIGPYTNIGSSCTIGSNVNIGSACNIGSYSNIGSACNIGSYSNIGSACNIGSYANIGSACNIGSYSNIGSACNIGSYSNIGSACNIGSATNIGSSCNIGSATNIGSSTIIGTECSIGIFGVIGENCVIGSGVIVGDHVVIGSNSNIADGYVIKNNTVVEEGSRLGFDEEASITIDGCSLTAYDTGVIGMNYYVSLPQNAVDQGYKAVLYSEENAVEAYSFAELAPDYSDESVSTYKLTYTNNAAAQLVDQIVVEIYAADGQMVVQKSMSISEYLQSVLQDVTDMTDEQITLAIRLLNYGSACQTHFAYKTEQMANNFLNDEEKINTVDLEKLDSYEKESIQSVDGLTYYGTSLILGSSTTVRHYFALEAGRDISEFTFSYLGEACAVHQKGVLYYVDLPAVDMYHAAEQQVLELTDGVQTGSIAYSVVNYAVKSGKINTDEPLGKLIRSLIAYQEMFAD